MLVLEQYGVRLRRMTAKDAELVRYWRNQSDIANFMEYRNYITPAAQIAWFASINNKNNYYFIIEFEGRRIGLINAKDYNDEAGFGEGGIFIWDKDYIGSLAAVFSSLCLLNFLLVKINVCRKSRVRILKTNERAIQYNKMLGYKLLPGQEHVLNQLYELDLDDYLVAGKKLNKAAAVLSDTGPELRYDGEPDDTLDPRINELLIHKSL